jgi:hypothetical protein
MYEDSGKYLKNLKIEYLNSRYTDSMTHYAHCKMLNVILNVQQDSVIYIFKETEDINSRRFCGIFLQGNGCFNDDLSLEWTIDVASKPEINRTDNKRENAGVSLYM